MKILPIFAIICPLVVGLVAANSNNNNADSGNNLSLTEKLLVIGGINSTNPLSSAALYDPVANVWSAVAAAPRPRVGAGAAVLNNKVYVCGGIMHSRSCDVYNPQTNGWTAGPDMIKRRTHFGLAASGNRFLYAIGGSKNDSWVEKFDPMTQNWTLVNEFPVSDETASVATANGSVFVAGTFYKSFYKFDPTTENGGTGGGEWVRLADMPTARFFQSLVSAGSYLYALSGFNPLDGELDIVERYDIATDQWEILPAMKMTNAKRNFGAVVMVENFYVTGGQSKETDFLSNAEKFPINESATTIRQWSANVAPMNEERAFHLMVKVLVPQ